MGQSERRTIPAEEVLGKDWELSEGGFRWEYQDGDDGAASSPANPATDRPSSRWRRAVGPWERVR